MAASTNTLVDSSTTMVAWREEEDNCTCQFCSCSFYEETFGEESFGEESFGEAEPEDRAEPNCECQYCYQSFYGEDFEMFCSTQCAARGAGMEKDHRTGIETLRENEKQPADFAPGKTYKEKIYNEEEPRDVQFYSKVVVQKDGTLKQMRGSIHLRNKTFKNWRAWRMFCWQFIY